MSSSLLSHPLFKLLLPIILVVSAITGMSGIIQLSAENKGFSYILPYIVLSIVLLLSQPFNQGRIGMIAISMAMAYWIIQERLQVPLSFGTTRIEFTLTAFLLPITMMATFIFPERRIFSKYGAGYLSVLLFMFIWCWIIVTHFSENDMTEIWETYLLNIPEISPLPIIIVLYSLVMCGLSAIFVLTRSNNTDLASYTCLLYSSLTFSLFSVDFISSTMFSIAGLLLLLYIISASHELAFIDQLTSIPGRRALESEMKHLGRRYTIAMLDIDHFKKFNDNYGHDTGDDVLKLVASIMAQTGGNAKVYRYGGEEFTVLFKGKTVEESLEYLEELREDIADYDLIIRDTSTRPKDKKEGQAKRGKANKTKVVNVTISIGVADNTEYKKPQEVIKASDKALYRAKDGGRNCVSL
ncbi:GGDEF domain-containing protein [Aliivibrio salmonicida]|uniref:diguanylate cyclase n=1 Tax=Aliivibrio salmonicida (strain LFI1238) TaxID=316275 RepID=B6ER60_ALISL|nr:GGDEF domain-containing protein [Aliivibrio salmonicida]CAQ81190.1 membrane associated GGDEF protein [Aliivibrio salmonicida LFI1238]